MAWIFLVASFIGVPQSYAGEWEKLMTDFEMYDEVIQYDNEAIEQGIEDQMMESNAELFPENEGEEDATDAYSTSDSHLTIKVDGVPVVLQDVPLFEWFSVYVRDVADKNLISGYKDANSRPAGQFGPADNVTIEQLAKIAVLAAGIDVYSCGGDIKNEAAIGGWSEKYIRCAEYLGWAVYAEGAVDIYSPATRTEVVLTVLQAFHVRISPRSGSLFEDVTTATPYAAAIETAAEAGIVSGYSDTDGNPTGQFGPDDFVNRAEAAKIFSLAFQVYGG